MAHFCDDGQNLVNFCFIVAVKAWLLYGSWTLNFANNCLSSFFGLLGCCKQFTVARRAEVNMTHQRWGEPESFNLRAYDWIKSLEIAHSVIRCDKL